MGDRSPCHFPVAGKQPHEFDKPLAPRLGRSTFKGLDVRSKLLVPTVIEIGEDEAKVKNSSGAKARSSRVEV
jgi:hypothetical protein